MSQKTRRGIIVILCLAFLTLFLIAGRGQKMYDCNAHPISLVGSLEMGISKDGYITQSFKMGGWQNNHPNGVTGFIGYAVSLPFSTSLKKDDVSSLDSWFAELGYKQHVTKWLFLHGYGGYNRIGKYAGAGIYVKCSDDLLSGLSYKQGIIAGALYFAF